MNTRATGSLAALRRPLAMPAVTVAALLLLEAIALFNALPHLRDALWQDEAVTLMFSSTHGPLHPFTEYFSPNNHPLFSAMMAAWLSLFPDGVTLPILRALPLACFLAAVPVVYAAARRLGGPLCALVAGLLFASSPIAAGFAAQIRGYGPSWLFLACALACALQCLRDPAWKWRIGYALASAGAVAILPSNLYLALVLAAGVAGGNLLAPARERPAAMRTSAWLLATPMLGLLAYIAIGADLVRFASMDLSPWTRLALLREWLRAPLADLAWLWLPVGAGAVTGAVAILRHRRGGAGAQFVGVAIGLAMSVAFAAMILLVPRVPFARTLVPFLPIWYCVLGCLAAYALERLLDGEELRPLLLGAATTALMLVASQPLPSCRHAVAASSLDGYDLCYQYFHDHYHPDAIADAWSLLGDPALPVVSDYEAFYALRVLGVPGLQVHEYRSYSGGAAPAIVAVAPGDLERIAAGIGADARAYRLVADTGYFKLYALPLR